MRQWMLAVTHFMPEWTRKGGHLVVVTMSPTIATTTALQKRMQPVEESTLGFELL